MSAKSSGINPTGRTKNKALPYWTMPLLDILAVCAWGILLLKYWLTGYLNRLIHPNYFGLVVVTGILLLLAGTIKGLQLFLAVRQQASATSRRKSKFTPTVSVPQHITLFPPGWSSGLLLGSAILGLLITPQVFTSQTAMQRGLNEFTTLTRSQPQSFRSNIRPEDRSIIDWVKTLNVYPEPDAYTGQKVKVQGFVVHPSDLSPQYLLISRFVITCCAADAYPVGLPVKLAQDRKAYSVDSWLEVEGRMITETLNGKRQLTIDATSLKNIPVPNNPYYY